MKIGRRGDIQVAYEDREEGGNRYNPRTTMALPEEVAPITTFSKMTSLRDLRRCLVGRYG